MILKPNDKVVSKFLSAELQAHLKNWVFEKGIQAIYSQHSRIVLQSKNRMKIIKRRFHQLDNLRGGI